MPVDFKDARSLSVKYGMGIGLHGIKQAMTIADERFGGDILLGLLWVCASGLAINVGGNLPLEQQRKAREEWNDNWARGRAADDRYRGHYEDKK